MPVDGTRTIDPGTLPAAADCTAGDEPLLLPAVEIFQVFAEYRTDDRLDLLPPAVHPAIPNTLSLTVHRCPEGPLGPFAFAEARVGVRLRDRPRALAAVTLIDSQRAAEVLTRRWGFRCAPATISLQRYTESVRATVTCADTTALDAALQVRQAIPGVAAYWGLLNPAVTDRGPRLVPVDMEHRFTALERGRPVLRHLDPAAFGWGDLHPAVSISATYATADITIVAPNALWRLDVRAGGGAELV